MDEAHAVIAEEDAETTPIMLDRHTYRLVPHLWSCDTQPGGHVSFADIADFMGTQNFRYTEGEGSRDKFRCVSPDEHEQRLLVHSPHPNA